MNEGPEELDAEISRNHFAIGVSPFNKDAVIRDLKQRGATPLEERISAGACERYPTLIGAG